MALIVMEFDGPLFDGRAAMWEALQGTQKEFQSRLPIVLPPKSTLPLLPPAPLISLICAELGDADRKVVTQTYQRHLKDVEKTQALAEEVAPHADRAARSGSH